VIIAQATLHAKAIADQSKTCSQQQRKQWEHL